MIKIRMFLILLAIIGVVGGAYTGFFYGIPNVHAAVLLTTAPLSAGLQPEEEFPDSQFGSPPIRSSREDALRKAAGRSPAGLEFSGQSGKAQPTAVLPNNNPSSPANINPEPGSISRVGVQEVALIAGDLGFFPKTIFVTQDIPVRLFVTGASKKSLCFMQDLFRIRRQVRSQKIEEITFTPNAVGQFRFYCPINGMEGTLLVKEGSLSSGMENRAGLGTGVGMVGSRPPVGNGF